MSRFLNAANLVTLLRLFLTPVVAYLILTRQPLAAVILFFLAGMTDVIDGAVARRLRLTTDTGAYFDPIVDKVLLSTVYICLAVRASIPWWFVVVIFARDILILAASGLALAFTGIRKFPPSIWGKLSTFLQLLTAGACMVRDVYPTFTFDSIAHVLVWLATAATVWSGLHYGWRGIEMIRTR